MRRGRHGVSALLFVVGCGAAALFAAAPQSQAPPRLSTSIDVIRLDVSAVDASGRAIPDLRPDEFDVTIDGAPRRVVVARFGGSGRGATESARDAAGSALALPAGGRAIAFVVDVESLRSGSERALLERAAALVSSLPPQDTVALAPVPGRALDLSTDRRPVVQALRQLKGSSPVFNHDFTFEEAVAMQRGDSAVSQAVVERECVHDPVPRQCPRELEVETRQRVTDARTHADHVLATLSGVARAMASLDAPRSIVLISAEVAFEAEARERFRMAEDAIRASGVAFYAIHVEQRQGDASTRGTASAGNSSSGLANLASSVGGAFYNSVGTGHGILERLRTELSESYLLAVESVPGDRDGRQHEIGVTVRRNGVRAAARPRWVTPRALTGPAPAPAAPAPTPTPAPAATPEPTPAPVTPPAPGAPPAAAPVAPAKVDDSALDAVMTRVSQYVTTYGERASAVVASEKYTQSVEGESLPRTRPRQMVAEFALVKIARASGWVGYRDVIEVNGKAVQDRRDRLIKALADSASPLEDAARIANESSRYNVGPVIRNFNVPTTALFFFDPANRGRFAYKREGTKRIEGIETWQIAFREVRTPTIVMTAAGRDVPARGTVWVNPADGTVVRTRLQLQGFADSVTGTVRDGTVAPTSAKQRLSMTDIESHADVDVTYRRDPGLQMWVPATMAEEYQGAIPRGNQPPVLGTSRSRAVYSDYRQFQTGARLSAPRDKQ